MQMCSYQGLVARLRPQVFERAPIRPRSETQLMHVDASLSSMFGAITQNSGASYTSQFSSCLCSPQLSLI